MAVDDTDAKKVYSRVMQAMTSPHVNEINSFGRKAKSQISISCTQWGLPLYYKFWQSASKTSKLPQIRKITNPKF